VIAALNSSNQLIIAIVKCGAFFAVWTELLKYHLDKLWLQKVKLIVSGYET
jgi:hypothetical protein